MKTVLPLAALSCVLFITARAGPPLPSDTYFSPESFDPGSPSQWPYTGGTSMGPSSSNIHLLEAWTRATGAGVRVGIVDDGLVTNHPDLTVDLSLSHNWNGPGVNDPTPALKDRRGTASAGLVAAHRNNRFATAGVAPDAVLAGLRLTAGETSDAQQAEALAWRNDVLDIKLNAWGYAEGFLTATAPGPLARAALAEGAATGRGGRGTIYVWAAGQDYAGFSANYNGYLNDIHVVAVSPGSYTDYYASSAKDGANILLSAPVEGKDLATTDSPWFGSMQRNFTGTPAASAMVAGAVALMLERNPSLGYRDVQEILIRSARRPDWTPAWPANGAGLQFYDKLGAGILDALAAVELAGRWENLPPSTSVSLSAGGAPLPIPDHLPAGAERTFDFSGLPPVRVEHVQVTVNATHPQRGQLKWVLVAPSGMESLLAGTSGDPVPNLTNWTFSSVWHWGERSTGVWRVRAVDDMNQPQVPDGTLGEVTVTLQGTPLAAPAAAPVLEGPFTAEGRVDEAFCYFIKGSSRPDSYSATGLPSGFKIAPATGQIYGRPSAPGVWPVTIRAANSQGTVAGVLTVTVLPRRLSPPVITSAARVEGIRTSPFFYRVTSSGASSVSVTELPDGLTYSSTTHLITGTLTEAGTFTATLSATNADGSTSAPLTIAVQEPAASPLGDALDLPEANWTTTGTGGWYRTTALSHDGSDAAAVTPVEPSEETGLRGTVQGPGVLVFWATRLTASTDDIYSTVVRLDGADHSIYASQPFKPGEWMRGTLSIPAGTHEVGFPVTRSSSFDDQATWLVDGIQIRTSAYNLWAAGRFSPAQMAEGTPTDPLEDPDHDGLPNLHEFAFNGDPLKPEALVTGEWRTVAGSRAWVFPRSKALTGIVSLTPQYSTDLKVWTDAGAQVIEDAGATENVRAVVPENAVPSFVRLKVVLTP